MIFVTLSAVGVVSAAYRGDKYYAAVYATNCSGAMTLLFVGLAVYYRAMILMPESEISGARYVTFDLAQYYHSSYYSEFLVFGYDYLTLIMCIMASAVFTFTFYSVIGSKETKMEWVVL